MNNNSSPKLWPPKKIAKYLTLSPQVVRNLAASEQIPHVDISHSRVGFDPLEIENWLLPTSYKTEYGQLTEFTNKPVYRVAQLPALLTLKHSQIYKMLNDGDLPGKKVGWVWLISSHWLHQWIQKHTINPSSINETSPPMTGKYAVVQIPDQAIVHQQKQGVIKP